MIDLMFSILVGMGLATQSRTVEVYEVWITPPKEGAKMEKYSETPTRPEAEKVVAALQVLGNQAEVRGPVTKTVAANTDAEPSLAWGNKVSKEFRKKVREIAARLGMDPNYLMAVMAFETGYSFDPAKENGAGSGATGLIQFMPNTAVALGTTTADLAKMTAEAQLDYVEKYLTPYKDKMTSIEDAYMAVFTPAAIGKGADHVLYSKPSVAYTQNDGLDADGDGKITVGEAAAAVSKALAKGNANPNVYPPLPPKMP